MTIGDIRNQIKADAHTLKIVINNWETTGEDFVSEHVKLLINNISQRDAALNEWESNFMDSIVYQFNRGFTMSERQIGALVKIFKKLEGEAQ